MTEKKCPKCGRTLPDSMPLGEFSSMDGVVDVCPFCGFDIWTA
jgi:rRNA maturation protein Nop10